MNATRKLALSLLLTAGLATPSFAQSLKDNAQSSPAGAPVTEATDKPAPATETAAEGSEAAQGQHGTAPQPGATSPSSSPAATAGLAPVGGSASVGKSTDIPGHVGNAGAVDRNHMDTGSHLVRHDWPFEGLFGTYDRAALQRGFQVYKQVCSACHSLNYLSYRNLEDIGYTEGQVKAIAATVQVDDISDSGETIQRPATPADHFRAPFANKKAAQAANNGAAPPDMSLLVKAREGGPDYIYSILTGYTNPPEGVKLLPGQYYNTAIVGHVIAMPPPLTTDGQVAYDGFTVASTKDQNARDVAQFLAWASEPHLEQRKRTGLTALIFLIVLAGFSYAYKRRLWKDIHH